MLIFKCIVPKNTAMLASSSFHFSAKNICTIDFMWTRRLDPIALERPKLYGVLAILSAVGLRNLDLVQLTMLCQQLGQDLDFLCLFFSVQTLRYGPEVIKNFMLNSAEHEMLPANKC